MKIEDEANCRDCGWNGMESDLLWDDTLSRCPKCESLDLTLSATYLNRMVDAYIECALWAGCYEDDPELGPITFDNRGRESDLTVESRRRMAEIVLDFYRSNVDLLVEDWTPEQAGHDLYLTQNGHGAGFWDRGLPNGKELTERAHAYGDSYIFEEPGTKKLVFEG